LPEKRRQYDAEFRAGAVRIVQETGEPMAQVARDLGVNEGALVDWVTRARQAVDATATGELSEPEREESRRLREDNARLRKGRRRARDGA
jgi:transposase